MNFDQILGKSADIAPILIGMLVFGFVMMMIANVVMQAFKALTSGSSSGGSGSSKRGGSGRGGRGSGAAHGVGSGLGQVSRGVGGGGGELAKGVGAGIGSIIKAAGQASKPLSQAGTHLVGTTLKGTEKRAKAIGQAAGKASVKAGKAVASSAKKAGQAAKSRYSTWQAERKAEKEAENAFDDWEKAAMAKAEKEAEKKPDILPMRTMPPTEGNARRYPTDEKAGPYVLSKLVENGVKCGVYRDEMSGQDYIVIPDESADMFSETLEKEGITSDIEGETCEWSEDWEIERSDTEEEKADVPI